MSGTSNLIYGMILDRILKGEPPLLSKLKIGLGLVALSGFFVLLGTGFLIFAAYLWLKTQFAPEIAFAFVGLMIISVGLSFAFAAYSMAQYQKRMFKRVKQNIVETVETVFDLLDEELKDPIGDNPKTAVLLAGLGGYAAGKKIL